MESHQYTRAKDDESSSFDSEANTVLERDSEEWQRLAPQRQRKFPSLLTLTIATLTVLSLSFATYRFIRSRSNRFSTTLPHNSHADFNYHDMTDQNEQHSRWQTPEGVWTSCGHSPHEAIARNCTFDIMAAVWLPPPCYNEQFAKKTAQIIHLDATAITVSPKHSLSMTNMTWHTDVNLSPETFIPLPNLADYFVDQYDKGERLLAYSIENFHVAHCLYMMRSALMAMQRVAAGEKDVYVHEQAMGAEHSEHCNDVIMNHEIRKSGVTQLEFGMGWCHKLS